MTDKPDGKRWEPWAAAVLMVATLLSYVGLFAFLWLSDHANLKLLILWVCGTALVFRLGMRALSKRYASGRS